MESLDVDDETVENIEALLARVFDSIDNGMKELVEHSGAAPRRWTTWDPRNVAALPDVDIVDLSTWISEPSPTRLPRIQTRMRYDYGGCIAVLRDISSSMDGVHATWAARVTLGLIHAARQRGIRVGYVEFNHKSLKHC